MPGNLRINETKRSKALYDTAFFKIKVKSFMGNG